MRRYGMIWPEEYCNIVSRFHLCPDKFREDCLRETMAMEAFVKKEGGGGDYQTCRYPASEKSFFGKVQGVRVYRYPPEVYRGGVIVRPGDTLCIGEDGMIGLLRNKEVMWATGQFAIMPPNTKPAEGRDNAKT